ncbi:5'-methylthioadenosine/S-adenosylhomocysteine nucleosidase [Streptomyces cylindrosporus]|uniref:5'-methylthioadenosine/S-adenosylhomocysteine nucleosidase n=1 Tax=Streptomyces cylindrosporus TaxID=2927583 RepID=A0ABS9Y7I0_9ACTN|nr:5'-methylthioadenosine/S-adenosylhomocysteine nucleosidase [Streptomyces cylindrosporus]MCI3273192.1 5'-methylthioadenosine/S-adenosylhomocysteine nucleosidase [Streptomyces cylindrosporus]
MSVPETVSTALVLTALPLEYAAVRAHIEERRERTHRDGTRIEQGRLPGTAWQVALAELGVGADRAAALTTQLITWLRPEAVLFVGVAGSLKDDVEIGDVVVGTQVYEIHGGKQMPEGFLVRPRSLPGSHALEQAARFAVRDMPDVRPHFAPIATGDVVLADADSDLARFIRRHYNDAAAIEMEGYGATQAAHLNGRLDSLVVRGISDHANADKHRADASGSQPLAAKQAAAVAVAVLRRHAPRGSASDQEGPHAHGGGGATYGGDHIDFRGGTFYGPVTGKRTEQR